MDKDLLHEIIILCLKMDEHAALIYGSMSQLGKDEKLKKFWEQMSKEEDKHVVCWKNLLELSEEKIIPQIFLYPEKTLKELKKNYNQIIKLSKQRLTATDLTANFVLAFRLEFYLLHPALERLWSFYKLIQNKGRYNPEKEYAKHIKKFIVAMRKFGVDTIELEALGESIERMWVQAKTMAKEANYDELTGILNRRGFFNVMTSLSYLAKRKRFNSAILMIDIDHFKRINDELGHQTGDVVLKTVADIIKTNIRDSDILGRYGGEEFLVFFPEIEKESVLTLAEKIRKAIQKETQQNVPVTASIGGSSTIIQGVVEEEIKGLIKKADDLMYASKKNGRNQVMC